MNDPYVLIIGASASGAALAWALADTSGEAGLTRRNPVGDTFAYHDHRCMGTT